MLGQLSFDSNGVLRDKVELAIQRLKAFEPPEGYYVAFSGGKDSQCVYHLCKMAGVKFDAHYAVTSVDPPELVKFIRTNYPDVEFMRTHYSDGKPEHYYADGRPKPITMWSLIEEKRVPPTRFRRYCCASLKETGGKGRIVVTGVRWAESSRRAKSHGAVDIRGRQKNTIKLADEIGANYKTHAYGGLVMNDDNDEARRMVEQCYRTQKTMVNPIVDWKDDDVWEFLNGNGIEHCCLYDQGFSRMGCIGCPLATRRNMENKFARYPKIKTAYLHAFGRMLKKNEKDGFVRTWKTPEEVMSWWLQEEPQLDGQVGLEELIE